MDGKSSLVEPVRRCLALKDVAPKWAKRLEQEKKLPFPLSLKWFRWYFELDMPSKCVVGEAYGFNSSYEKECEECNTLGWRFGHSFLVRSRSELETDVQNFLMHWNEKHSPPVYFNRD
ncbi:hypothetical protein [Nitrososphaera sp. AFS]|uniref:hypothetical protein n=1 Tax=Nitrososphaera sp. AFS TaxID=2301191 RepID=UPI0013921F60|nr:hypothetical protein [Nitrososphaera sp. AFS]NAL78069.1 hypothetical protein [Nitrososphaera sp. AFS]